MEEPAFSNWHGSVRSAGQNALLMIFDCNLQSGEILPLSFFCLVLLLE